MEAASLRLAIGLGRRHASGLEASLDISSFMDIYFGLSSRRSCYIIIMIENSSRESCTIYRIDTLNLCDITGGRTPPARSMKPPCSRW